MEEQLRLEKLKKTLLEQAKKDRERIEMRNKVLLDKKLEIITQKQNKKFENELREKRLQKFYESVKPKVESDPTRMISYTQAEYNRRGLQINEEGKYVEAKPIFSNYGFTDKQLNSDARTRIEQRLRQAGLINNEYARNILNSIKPAQNQNKRDLNANSFWNGFSMKDN